MPFLQNVNTNTLEAWRSGDQIAVKDGYEAMLRKVIEYGSGKPSVNNGSLVFTGVGNGLLANLDMPVDGPTETWTLTATNATTFTVVGSITGALGNATVDVAYSDSGLSFTIENGGVAFQAGDNWTWGVTVGALASPSADQWIIDEWEPNNFVPNDNTQFLHWHGQGDGTEAIYCSVRLIETPGSQIWNWQMRCGTGYSPGLDFDQQPGQSADIFTAFIDTDMRFWLALNARRYTLCAEVSGTTYHSMYQGFFNAYGSPNEYPYPICIQGEKDDEEAWNSTATDFVSIGELAIGSGQVRTPSGLWANNNTGAGNNNVTKWPRVGAQGSPNLVWDNHENFDNGDHQLFPIVFLIGQYNPVITGSSTYGEMEGVRIVTGFGQTAENILNIGGNDNVVFPDIFRNERDSFWAMEMV